MDNNLNRNSENMHACLYSTKNNLKEKEKKKETTPLDLCIFF